MHTVALHQLRTAVDGAGRYVRALARLRPDDRVGFALRASAWAPGPGGSRLGGAARGEIAERLARIAADAGGPLGGDRGPLLQVEAIPHDRGALRAGIAPRTTRSLVRDAGALHAAIERLAPLAATHAVVVVPAAPHGARPAIVVTRDPESGAAEAHALTSAARPLPIAMVPRLRRDPGLLRALERISATAETACRDVCRIDLAVHGDTVGVLAVRPAVRTPAAGLRIAVDLVDIGLTSIAETLDVLSAELLDTALADGADRPEVDLGRVLGWADERRRLPLLAEAPRGRPAISRPGQFDGTPRPVIVVPLPGDVESQLHEIAEAAERDRIPRLALRVNRALRAADLQRLPLAPWDGLVASPDDPCARVLAARLLEPEPPGTAPLAAQPA